MNPLRWLRRLISIVIIFLIAFPAYVAAAIWWTGTHPSSAKADVIVVLGAAQYNGRPGEILKARLEHARAIYQAGQAPRIITTGSRAPGDITTEAQAGKNWLHIRGINSVSALAFGRDTYQSTKAYTSYMKDKAYDSAVIVTDPWHCFRARAMARSLDVTATCSPSTTGPGVPATWKYFQRELLAYLAFTILGPDHSWATTPALKSLESHRA